MRSFLTYFLTGSGWLALGLGGCDSVSAPPQRPTWDKTLPPAASAATGATGRGLAVVRGIIHLHSVYSHDACDNQPQVQGAPNQPCYQHFRQGLCATRQDFAMVTDHAGLMAPTPWESLFLQQPGDEAVVEAGEHTGSRLRCDGDAGARGQRVLLTVGGENVLMPVTLNHHVGATPAERAANMTADDPDAVRRFVAAGAVVLQAHGESRSLDLLRTLADAGLGGMEVYNLHANVDPKIRSEFLGLPAFGALNGLAPWLFGTPVSEGGPEPDLAALGFLEENRNQIDKYDALLGDGRQVTAMIGSDIHENTVAQVFSDGERGDSYRRLMRWFSNHLLVPTGAPLQPALIREALQQGRAYGVFEVFGVPDGFDFYAQTPSGPIEMGGLATQATLHLAVPRLGPGAGTTTDAVPTLRVRILRIARGASQGAVVLDRTVTHAEAQRGLELTYEAAQVGAYRAEIRVVPGHLLPLLGADGARYMKEYPYLYTNPIYVPPFR